MSKGKRENVCVCVYVLMPHPFALHNIYTQTMAGRRPIVFPVYFAHSILVGSISNTHTTVHIQCRPDMEKQLRARKKNGVDRI